jgi:hypothetical protein
MSVINMVQTVTLLLFLFCCLNGFSQQNDCILKKRSDDIQVYTCKSGNVKFKSLKAEFAIKNTTVDELLAFIKNVKNFPTWQYNMISAELLLQETENKMITRSEIDAPWPVDNRELIVEYTLEKDATLGQLHIIVKTVAYDYPKKKGVVRVPFSHAEWLVVKDGTALKVRYTMRVDPGGNVPAWLVNMAMAEAPYRSFINLKQQLE